jgi:hypothetical protein
MDIELGLSIDPTNKALLAQKAASRASFNACLLAAPLERVTVVAA